MGMADKKTVLVSGGNGGKLVPEPAAEKGFKIERLYYTLEGKPVDPAKAKPYTKTAFTNLHIIRVGPAGGANTRGISSSLTVIVTLKQDEDPFSAVRVNEVRT